MAAPSQTAATGPEDEQFAAMRRLYETLQEEIAKIDTSFERSAKGGPFLSEVPCVSELSRYVVVCSELKTQSQQQILDRLSRLERNSYRLALEERMIFLFCAIDASKRCSGPRGQ